MTENRKIKICHLSSVHFALDTRIFYRMCRSLSLIYDVSLIAVHPKEEIRDGIHIIPFRRFHNRRLRIAIGWLLIFFKAIRTGAKIYHLHDPELIPCGLLLKCAGKKVILDIHENIAEDLFDKPWIKNKRMVYSVFHFFERVACRFFVLILAETSYEMRYRKLNADFTTVLNYCDQEFFKPYKKTGYKRALKLYYIGIILENRGILQIIEAIRLLLESGHKPEFHCVGELYSDLDRKIKALPHYDQVKSCLYFHGRMNLPDGYQLVKEMDIGLCIIWPMHNSMDSYPTKLFEYMSCGLPIITSSFPLYRSVVEANNCGLCVDPMNPGEIAEAILQIHSDVEKSERMGFSGIKAVSGKYGWDSQVPLLAKVYARLSPGTR